MRGVSAIKSDTILLVEDDDADAFLTKRALEQELPEAEIYRVCSVADALDYLAQIGKYALAPRPDCILIDLNLPGLTGEWLLAEIAKDTRLSNIPVLVLSSDPERVKAVHDREQVLGAVDKPSSFEAYHEATEAVSLILRGALKPTPLPANDRAESA